MTKIKICGITNHEDAENAADLGADFLGFNFYSKSPRYVDYDKFKDIIRQLKGKLGIVGIFVNETTDNVKKIAETCNLNLIQLSGDEDLEYVNALKNSMNGKNNKKIIKTFRIKNKLNPYLINSFNSDYVMIDSFREGIYGGTGKSLDLNIAKDIDNKRLFLAGGLNKGNVKMAIDKINPFAVDVCSGIESEPGKKDYNKMKKFIEAVK